MQRNWREAAQIQTEIAMKPESTANAILLLAAFYGVMRMFASKSSYRLHPQPFQTTNLTNAPNNDIQCHENRPTPETDAEINKVWNSVPKEKVDANFSRRLERERDEAREQVDRLTAFVERLESMLGITPPR